jgi:HTH-type transcriptional regulator, glycine betaine synthesis regulator
MASPSRLNIDSRSSKRETLKKVATSRVLSERLPLSPPEVEVISTFIHLARVTGIPRSVAEIFGLLFVCPQPIPADEVMERLNLSAGAASVGLRQLKDLGAVKGVYIAGERRDHYTVETGSEVAASFFQTQIRNYAATGSARLERLSSLLQADETQSCPGIEFLRRRVEILLEWHGEITRISSALTDAEPVPQEPDLSRKRNNAFRTAPADGASDRIPSNDKCATA